MPRRFRKVSRRFEKNGPLAARPPKGESILDVIDRVSLFLREAGKEGNTRIAVAHGLGVLSIEAVLMKRTDEWLLENQDTTENSQLIHFYKGNDGKYYKETIEDTLIQDSLIKTLG